MTPNKVTITGYKRFKNSNVLLDRKLIAFVGPNEAGKSSFFNALLSIENTERYENNELTRGSNFADDDTIIQVDYLLNSEEKELLTKFNGIGNIRFYSLWKSVEGKRFHKLIGDVNRNKSHRKVFVDLISALLEKDYLKSFFDIIISEDEDEESLKELISSTSLDLVKETLDEEEIEEVEEIKRQINAHSDSLSKQQKEEIDKLLNNIDEFLTKEKATHPKDKLLKHFDNNRPEFVFFSNEERFLKGEYSLEELKSPPSSLANLLSLAEVDSDELVSIIENKESGKRLKLLENANKKLHSEYNSSWSQSEVYPQFIFDVDGLKIQISYTDTYTEIQERSDGLKQYISLKAFLATRESGIPPILLIDEAEIHLHYSAQSDLVSEFEKQKIANSILYTTHSAGCLPSDLGTGVRVVEPIFEGKNDTGISRLNNSIWQNSGGFSPLLLAMGANIIAFTLARKAIIAEGPSETILLPRLIREATNLDYLDFQVAPGIASISKNEAKSFELEAAKVVYLVDGDGGGNENRKKLKKGGVEENKIKQLPQNYAIEDFVDSQILANSINREFETSGKPTIEFEIENIPNSDKINWFANKCEESNQSLPSKVKIAENISKTTSDETILDEKNKDSLIEIYNQLNEELNK